MGDTQRQINQLRAQVETLMSALLPRTSQEEALIRPATDWAASTARQAADEAIERGTGAVDAAASAAYQAARGTALIRRLNSGV